MKAFDGWPEAAAREEFIPSNALQGTYAHEPPDFATSGQIGEYIQNRTAAWVEHRARQHRRREARDQNAPPAPGASSP